MTTARGFWDAWRSERRRGMRVLIGVATAMAVGCTLVLAAWVQACRNGACPAPAGLEQLSGRSTSRILAADGSVLATVGYERRGMIPLDSMAPIVRQAFLVAEDRRFFRHNGVDYLRVFGALGANISHWSVREGFSTITMQLARGMWPETLDRRERTIGRKIREIQVAWEIEREFTKPRILELYLNQVLLGPQIYGVEPAAEELFGKSAADLNVAEAAMLAALPKGPSSYNPRRFPERATARRNLVIDLLQRNGDLTSQEASSWKQAPLGLVPEGSRQIVAPYFVDYVRAIVGERFGDQLRDGGLRIYTTLDPAIQGITEQALERQLAAIEKGRYGAYRRTTRNQYLVTGLDGPENSASPYLQGMAVVMEPSSGHILALVGGRDWNDSKFNRATQARRQAGSAFKPFVYSAAVRRGIPLSQIIEDTSVSVASDRYNEPAWAPQNADYGFQGAITLRQALYLSRNAATVRLGMEVGLGAVIYEARLFGITTPLRPYPSILLGAVDVIPLELVSAYSAFATLGVRAAPMAITRVEDSQGHLLWEPQPERTRVMDVGSAFLMTDALRDVVRRGTAYSAVTGTGFSVPAGGKTGTSDDYADAWFIGFTPDLVAGVWTGMDRRQQILRGAQGGKLAAPVWTDIMRQVYLHRSVPAQWVPPFGVVSLAIDGKTGLLFGPNCPEEERRTEYFLFGTEPVESCPEPIITEPSQLTSNTN
ncbi:MAG: PBP1A family penicillin-binding protein [Gemmatimonadota bacterium]